MTPEQIEAIRKRLKSEALPAMGRLIQSAFGGRDARLSIPARSDDDDLTLARFLGSDVFALLDHIDDLTERLEDKPPPVDVALQALANAELAANLQSVCRGLGIPDQRNYRRLESICRELAEDRDRLMRWMERIDGGDTPCNDSDRIREWAYQAVMGQMCPEVDR